MQKNIDNPVVMETHDSVPLGEVGFFVQECVKGGTPIVVVTRNPDQRTCTISVQRD